MKANLYRESIFQTVTEPVKTEAKKAFVTATVMIKYRDSALIHGINTQINDPEIGQTSGEQKPMQAFGIGEMAFIEMKSSAFRVREKSFDQESFAVQLTNLGLVGEVAEQIDRFLILLFPHPRPQ